MSTSKDLGETIQTIVTNERMTEISRGQEALSEGLSIARESGHRARRDNLALQEENLELTVEIKRLKAMLSHAQEEVGKLFTRAETYARTIVHLRTTWEPHRDEEARREDVKEIIGRLESEIAGDAAFREKLRNLKERFNHRRR